MTFNEFVYSKKPLIRISRHILFWTADLTFYLVIISDSREITRAEVLGLAGRMPFIALLTYFIMYYLIPRYSTNGHKGELLVWIIGCMAYIGLGTRAIRVFIIRPTLFPELPPVEFWNASQILNEIFVWLSVIFMAITIKLIKNKTELQQRNEQLLQEKKMAELSFLKAQMHPHFLFNTLNTLYSETIQGSGKAQQVILHLSNLLRFILDECSKPLISLHDEIKVMEDFIALEQLRHGSRLNVTFSVSAIDHSLAISPLIFLPFVENSFKHSLNQKRGRISIVIALTVKNKKICLSVENDKEESPRPVNGFNHNLGKGILNVKRQLELLYGKDYLLQIENGQAKYHVLLEVPAKFEKYA